MTQALFQVHGSRLEDNLLFASISRLGNQVSGEAFEFVDPVFKRHEKSAVIMV